MNKIIEEARELGISLVGWVVIEDDRGETLCRTTDYGSQVRLQRWDNHFGENESFDVYLDDICQNIKNSGLAEALAQAEAFATMYPSRGWAPAPIGYVLSEWLTEAIAEVDKLWDKAYNDDLKGDYSSYHSGEKDAYDKCLDILKRFQPAPPEVKG